MSEKPVVKNEDKDVKKSEEKKKSEQPSVALTLVYHLRRIFIS